MGWPVVLLASLGAVRGSMAASAELGFLLVAARALHWGWHNANEVDAVDISRVLN